jgi:ribonuclease P protein component
MSSETGVAREERDLQSDRRGILTIGEKIRFAKVMTRGRSVHRDGFSLKFIKDDTISENLYGFVLKRRFARAHLRNRYRRIAREYLRLNRFRISQGYLVVIAFHGKGSNVSFGHVARGLDNLFAAARLILGESPISGPDGWKPCSPDS